MPWFGMNSFMETTEHGFTFFLTTERLRYAARQEAAAFSYHARV